jgi:hypothetical protein
MLAADVKNPQQARMAAAGDDQPRSFLQGDNLSRVAASWRIATGRPLGDAGVEPTPWVTVMAGA